KTATPEFVSAPSLSGSGITLPPASPEQIEEDSRTLLAIMERARKLLEQENNAFTPQYFGDDSSLDRALPE
ncbi:MAG: hypothetical protein OWT28_11930, partial [Firmicutes bacterium]|nr:hypothetical protein [Bacillota bacterium]